MEEHNCAENLRELLFYLDERMFDGLHQEVTSAVELSDLLRRYTDLPAIEIQSQTLLSKKTLTQGRGILDRLLALGDTREEIIAKLNQGLDSCGRCSQDYDKFLDGIMAVQMAIGSPYQDKQEADSYYLRRY